MPVDGKEHWRWLHYKTWPGVSQHLETIARRSRNAYVKSLAKELVRYMNEHRLVRSNDSLEIYAREINEEVSLDMFLDAHIYGCGYQKEGGRISRAAYFAPCFGQYIARLRPGVFSGFSYVAKIEAIETTTDWHSYRDVVSKHRGKLWMKKHKELLDALHRHKDWSWKKEDRRTIAFLGTPRLVFNPPVNKDLLQKGKGFLSRNTFSFDELFNAWGKSSSARIR
jgi:hypothetical protein